MDDVKNILLLSNRPLRGVLDIVDEKIALTWLENSEMQMIY